MQCSHAYGCICWIITVYGILIDRMFMDAAYIIFSIKVQNSYTEHLLAVVNNNYTVVMGTQRREFSEVPVQQKRLGERMRTREEGREGGAKLKTPLTSHPTAKSVNFICRPSITPTEGRAFVRAVELA